MNCFPKMGLRRFGETPNSLSFYPNRFGKIDLLQQSYPKAPQAIWKDSLSEAILPKGTSGNLEKQGEAVDFAEKHIRGHERNEGIKGNSNQ